MHSATFIVSYSVVGSSRSIELTTQFRIGELIEYDCMIASKYCFGNRMLSTVRGFRGNSDSEIRWNSYGVFARREDDSRLIYSIDSTAGVREIE